MSHIVHSLEHAVEAGVKGIIGIAEGYMGAAPSSCGGTPAAESLNPHEPQPQPPQPAVSTSSTAAAASASSAAAPIPIAGEQQAHATTSSSANLSVSSLAAQRVSRLGLQQESLVQLADVQSGWIHLQSTYLDSAGGQRRVRSFGLRNVSSGPVDVEVGSDLGPQVVFWVAEDNSDVPEPSSSSSVSSMSSSAGAPSINLSIPPGSATTVFLAFQPTTSRPPTPGTSTPSSDGGFTPRVVAAAAPTTNADLSPLPGSHRLPSATIQSGSMFSDLSSQPASSVASGVSGLSLPGSGHTSGSTGPRRNDPVHRSFSVHGSVLVHATTQDTGGDDLLTLSPSPVQQAHQNISLPFFATVCRSFFSAAVIDPSTGLAASAQLSSGQLSIDFGTDNVVGNEVHRDILLVNRSEIDLVWTTSVLNSSFKDSVWFSLRDLDSENVFGVETSTDPVPLPALSSRHLRLDLRPLIPVADFEFDFVISNAHQTGNVVTCKALGSCQATAQDDTLRIQSGSTIDFGQIPDGTWAKKLIATKNIGDRPIDVHFSATPGYEVVFRLAGVAGEDIDEDVPIRPRDKRMETLSRTSTRDTRDSGGARGREISGAAFRFPLDMVSQGSSTGGRSALFNEAGSVSSGPFETDEWATTASDRDSSMPPSRPLSRVTSRGSSYRPSRTEESDDDEQSPQTSQPLDGPDIGRGGDNQNLGDRDIPNQIEELTMRPGTEYRVFAMYRPARDLVNPPEIAGSLRTSTFKVFLDSAPISQRSRPIARSRKVIHCTAESCTSIVTIPSGKFIDFGEVTVGASKSTTFEVQNLSAISARVEVAAISKVLMTNRNVIVIPPYETVTERLDFFPRRINDRYEKQVFVRNHLNRANNQLIEVRSKNVDVYNVTLHSHLYRILTPSGSNFLDFGSVVVHSPTLRTVQFQNLTHKPLVLDLSASDPEDIQLFVKRADAPITHAKPPCKQILALDAERPPQNGGNLKERFVESLEDRGTGETKAPTKSKARDKSATREKKDGDKLSLGASLASALKKGGRGKPVQIYGNAVVFRDRSLLDDHEYLDLASGPPCSTHHKTLPSSKRSHLLETIAHEDPRTLSGQHPKVPKLDFAASAKSSGLVSKEVKAKKSKSTSGIKREATTPKPATPTKVVSTGRSGEAPTSPLLAPILRTPLAKEAAGTKSPALTGKRIELKTDPATVSDVAKLTPDELIVAIEHHDARRNLSAVTHFTADEEEQYVRRLLALRKELAHATRDGKFLPCHTLTVPPGSSRQVVVIMTPAGSTRAHITTRAKRCESRINIKVLDYEKSVIETAMGPHATLSQLPVRDLIIRSSCVRSVLEVQQSSINFGTCERGDVKSRTIVIHNKSDCVGIFRMRTSGSIASGNLKLGLGRYGVVSAFGRKEVASFSFTPSMVGNYQETILVENVLDSHNDQNVLVKATVRKMPAFSLDVTKLDFAPPAVGAWPASTGFVITNTSKTERTFVVETEAAAADVAAASFAELSLSRDEKDAGVALSQGEEEEVEGLLQKLKIARRKNKPDKIAKYEKRLGELGVVTASSEDSGSTDAEDATESGAATPPVGEVASVPSISITLGPSKKAKVLVNLVPRTGSGAFASTIKVYERKNTDETVTIDVSGSPNPVAAITPVSSSSSSTQGTFSLSSPKRLLLPVR